jgi:hypothetical protein
MSGYHYGKGAIIGFTIELTVKVISNVVVVYSEQSKNKYSYNVSFYIYINN